MSAFSGLSPDLIPYLVDLEDHNDKDWFNAHKDRYTRAWLEPAVAFVDALLPRITTLSPPIHGEARVNGSIWRIQRDIRFSKDKTPYKTHQAFRFWYGNDKKAGAGFYVRVSEGGAGLGAGLFHMERDQLERYREVVASPEGATLQRLIDGLKAAGWDVGGEATKRVPRGYDADHPRAELLKHKGLYVIRETQPDPRFFTPEAIDVVVDAFQAAAPLATWLQTHVVRGSRT